MKRYIRTSYEISPELEKFNRQMIADFEVEVVDRAYELLDRGGYIYIFRVKNGHNVYRVFADDRNMELIFQQIEVAFYVHGEEHWDDPVDYKNVADVPIPEWIGLVKRWADECEADDPHFTYVEQIGPRTIRTK